MVASHSSIVRGLVFTSIAAAVRGDGGRVETELLSARRGRRRRHAAIGISQVLQFLAGSWPRDYPTDSRLAEPHPRRNLHSGNQVLMETVRIWSVASRHSEAQWNHDPSRRLWPRYRIQFVPYLASSFRCASNGLDRPIFGAPRFPKKKSIRSLPEVRLRSPRHARPMPGMRDDSRKGQMIC